MLRVLTYNVHSCIGTDGLMSIERIATVIAAETPDVVLLQEIDVGRLRTGRHDQAHRIAEALHMTRQFHAALTFAEESYGDAILSRLPMTLVKAGPLLGPRRLTGERRGALWVRVEVEGRSVDVLNCHLGVLPHQQAAQVADLSGPDWSGSPALSASAILGGDFNAPPGTPTYRRLAAAWTNAFRGEPGDRRGATFPSRRPFLRLDHLWHRPGLRVTGSRVVRTALTRLASDHLPLLAEFAFADPDADGTAAPAAPFRGS
ncbi:MAG: endonuclease/exonuclease/phosphatase family protein [Bosea sp.]|nr:endonuclease/exonuclease/phosphatase family protein [Bosea sp. (in: a-proteobacteria)]